MRVLFRAVIIVLAALAVSGVTYEVGQAGVLSSVVGAGRGEGRQGVAGGPNQSSAGTTVAAGQGQGPAAFQRGGGEQEGFSVFGLVQVGKSFAIIAVVVVLVAPLVGFIQRRKRAQHKTLANGPNASA